MILLILGLFVILMILIVVLCSIYNSDIVKIEVKVTSKGIEIKILKKDKPSKKHKKNKST